MIFTAIDIKDFRKKHNLTQEQFAELLGVSWRTVQNYESGFKIPKSKNALLRVVFDEYEKKEINNKKEEWSEEFALKVIEALYLHSDKLKKYDNYIVWENSIRADEKNKVLKEMLKKRLDNLGK